MDENKTIPLAEEDSHYLFFDVVGSPDLKVHTGKLFPI
jgi:hypothetical protein